MKEGKLKITPFLLAVFLVLLALAAELVYMGNFEYRFLTRRFNRILWEKENIMGQCLEGMKPILASGVPHGTEVENNLFARAGENGITILEYLGDRLISWSDTDFDAPRVLHDSLYSKPFVFLQNGWFLTGKVEAGPENILGLLRLRSDYSLENDIISNGFEKDFRIPASTGFSFDRNASDYHVYSSDGTFLFSLIYPPEKGRTGFIHIPLFLWGLAFIAILYLVRCLARCYAARGKHGIALLISSGLPLLVYLIVLIAGKPAVLSQTELFSPFRYTMNGFIPSLGHLFLLSILLSMFAFMFFLLLKDSERIKRTGISSWHILTLLLFPGSLMFSLYHEVFTHLVFNSNINFETYKVLNLDLFSLVGFMVIILLFSVPFLYILLVFRSESRPSLSTVCLAALATLLPFPLFFGKELLPLLAVSVFWLSVVLLLWFFSRRDASRFNRSLVLSLALSVYSLFVIAYYSSEKNKENIKIQLLSYSTENDPTAEHLLLDMWPVISSDTTLKRMMDVPYFGSDNFNSILTYLHERYFTGYWGNYNLSIVLCRRNDSLSVGIHNQFYEDCYSFFDERIIENGHQLTGTGFYFIDSKQGRASYLGRLFFDLDNSRHNGLFIDLYSDIRVFQPGYSELLLDKKYHGYAKLKDYSFAKYINGDLVIRTGDFPFNTTDLMYVDDVMDYGLLKADSHKLFLYRNGNVTVVIGSPVVSFQDILISFAYIFVFVFLFSSFINFISMKPSIGKPVGFNFRQKMQLSFIGILIISFTLIGFVIASLTIRQHREKHYENIKEKLSSINMELDDMIFSERDLSRDWKDDNNNTLEEVLVRLSNIFNTDINLYDSYGFLISSSRPEIYYRDLVSRRMDNIAFINMFILKKTEYFQQEKIGKLEYVSGYAPFYNIDNELLTYVNLPYFRMQSILAREISGIIVAVINFTLLLIVLATGLAVIISQRLTAPLAMLSSRLASVELGKKSEHLSYKGNDEVGDLVRQYNRMVDELEQSAQKLANSEREYAWREMAKQIAHEIKNPLTPMKLNVQQLFKLWTDGVPGFEERLERFTRNQIEYIDNLSSIASAFSSFARIPVANPVELDLLEQIRITMELFKSSDGITFRISAPHSDRFIINADKEQVNSIFSNLIKNAIQSIPPGKAGVIKVNLKRKGDRILVSVCDNGCGIPESLKSKMFTPNFTTKSSGTGLGLSIVKRNVENAGGTIWFESEAETGTCFHIEFPPADIRGLTPNP
ncbi:MAG: HAMP domain-containing protein [Bacteroidales bacterium]|nr:HAMP domain-containing protein [Bacteroidales bacterium]